MSFTRNFNTKPNFSGMKHRENKNSLNRGGFSNLEISKRDVYPQFSEPDEYNTTVANHSTTLKSFCYPSKKYAPKERNLIYSRPSGGNDNMHQSTSRMQLPTFRQYVTEAVNDDMEQCYDDSFFGMRGPSTHAAEDNENGIYSCRSGMSKSNESFIYKDDKNKSIKPKNQKELIGTRARYAIGTIDQVIRWYKTFKDAEYELLFEVAGVLESKIKKGDKLLMFIRSDSGHILQGVFYNIDRELPDFQPGATITAIGNMIGSNKLQIFDAAEIKRDDFTAIQRLAFLSQRSLQEPISNLN